VVEERTYSPLHGRHITTAVREEVVPEVVRVSPSRKPVLRLYEEDELVHALKEQCNLEAELERAKIHLAQMTDFNLHDAFGIFDISRLGSVSAADIQNGLNAIGLFPTYDECALFVTRYD